MLTPPYPRISQRLRTSLRTLQRAAERDARRQFVVEGLRACEDACAAGARPDVVVVHADADARTLEVARTYAERGAEMWSATTHDMELICDATSPQGIVAVLPFPAERAQGDRVIVLDGLRDPGNAGTIVRTAAWFGFTDVVFLQGCVDPFHPKVVRSTAGALTRVNVLRDASIDTVVAAWGGRGPIVATVVDGGMMPSDLVRHDSIMLLVGSEANGLSETVQRIATHRVTIHGAGTESLNAAVATAILCYEWTRPR